MNDSFTPQIIIGLTATPNVPTDGYLFIRHDTEPTAESREAVYWIAEQIIARLGSISDRLTRLEFDFHRGRMPGDLTLKGEIELMLPSEVPFIHSFGYPYFGTTHMRMHAKLQDILLAPLFNELAMDIARLLRIDEDHTATLRKWLDVTGQPKYGDHI